MSSSLATRIIDGDGHIIEDHAGIIAHMETPYREIANRKGIVFPPLDHLHTGRAVETPPGPGAVRAVVAHRTRTPTCCASDARCLMIR